MKPFYLLGIFGLCLACTGCRFYDNVYETMVVQQHQFPEFIEDKLAKRRYRQLAERRVDQLAAHNPQLPLSDDYIHGFEDGFSDYLFAGGNGQPPLVPPRQYWRSKYQSDRGREAVHDWFAGFRDGAADAKASGRRDLITVPSSLGVSLE